MRCCLKAADNAAGKERRHNQDLVKGFGEQRSFIKTVEFSVFLLHTVGDELIIIELFFCGFEDNVWQFINNVHAQR